MTREDHSTHTEAEAGRYARVLGACDGMDEVPSLADVDHGQARRLWNEDVDAGPGWDEATRLAAQRTEGAAS